MCNPIAAIALSLAGTVIQGISAQNAARQQADIAKAEAENAARVAEHNAELARNEAKATEDAAAKEEARLRENIRRVTGAQTAIYGASGVQTDTGSPLDTVLDTQIKGEQDADALRQNYYRKSFALKNEASMLDYNASESRKMGQAKASAYTSAGNNALFSSLISSASTVASQWDNIFPKKGQSPVASASWAPNSGASYGESYSNPLKPKRSLYKGFWGLD